MSETADVVIIGGGIVGSSIAYHLTAAGCHDVLVIERETYQGKGSTGKSMGGVRAQFTSEPNIRMSLYSIPFFQNFETTIGHPSGYKPQGYLFVATHSDHLTYLKKNLQLQVSLGLKTAHMLTRHEIVEMLPQIRSDDILGGSFCTTDGFVDPYSVMMGFITRATANGARLWRDTEVTGIDSDSDGVAGVRTSKGAVAARTIVSAAGPWAAEVARMIGVQVPVEPLRRMLIPTEPFDELPRLTPMVIDMATGFHFRPEGLGLLLAWNDPQETPGFKTGFDPDFIEKVLTRAVDRFPCFERLEVNPKRAWAGLYEMTPDHHCILGPVESVRGFFLANGFSGHGVMHSPATGRIVSDLILKGTTELIDPESLSLARFSENRMIHEAAVL